MNNLYVQKISRWELVVRKIDNSNYLDLQTRLVFRDTTTWQVWMSYYLFVVKRMKELLLRLFLK